jgi:Na+-transporting NADH:ubiquinone oxidoreductase subunit C
VQTKKGDYNVRQSNLYIILYSAGLTIFCGAILAFASISLKDKQDANIALEQKGNILSTVTTLDENANIEQLYAQRIRGFVIDYNGNEVPTMEPSKVAVASEYKKKPEERVLPVYEFINESDSSKVMGFGITFGVL